MRTVSLLIVFISNFVFSQNNSNSQQYSTRQGQVSFFSYTSAENIEANNNQVFSIVDFENKEIAVSLLMRAFSFKKTLMYQHFNQSYVESDVYPKATLTGEILDLVENELPNIQTKIIKGDITIHGITRAIEIKTVFKKIDQKIIATGEFELLVKDFEIKIPPILSKNIAETIAVKFRFEYMPYDENE